jgi:dTDP-4-dehydrorhamnose 3,5-epimerase
MKFTQTAIPGVLIIDPQIFGDARGHFSEVFNQRRFDEAIGRPVRFVQDNHSRSAGGVLRGLHCQLPPHEQGKLVRVAAGRVLDVVVDVRPESQTCGQWIAEELSSENLRQLWVPEGMAHGFLVLSESADLHYKVTEYYAPAADRSIRWDDPQLGIDWPDLEQPPVVSQKDQDGKSVQAVLDEIRAARLQAESARDSHGQGIRG